MKNIALIIGSMMAGGIIAVGGYMYFASAHPSANTPPAAEKARNVLFWYDPMYPNTRFDKPGKSPFMDMDWCRNTPMKSLPAPLRRESVSIRRKRKISA